MAYKLEFVDEAGEEDLSFESHGVTFVHRRQSLAYIDGTELDFVREGLNEGLQVQQPQRQERVRLRRKLQRLTRLAERAWTSIRIFFTLFQLPRRFALDRAAGRRLSAHSG